MGDILPFYRDASKGRSDKVQPEIISERGTYREEDPWGTPCRAAGRLGGVREEARVGRVKSEGFNWSVTGYVPIELLDGERRGRVVSYEL